MRLELRGNRLRAVQEPGDPRFRDGGWGSAEGTLLYHVMRILNRWGFDLIKKRMWRDGHMVSDHVQYLRTRTGGRGPEVYIWNDGYQVHDSAWAFNITGYYDFLVDYAHDQDWAEAARLINRGDAKNQENPMGYTHYFDQRKTYTKKAFWTLAQDCIMLLDSGRIDFQVSGWEGTGEPVFTKDQIAFNGCEQAPGGDESHESFIIHRVCDQRGDFCKTAQKPYDLLVTAVLIRAALRLPGFKVQSDGDPPDWEPGLALCRAVFAEAVLPLGVRLNYPCHRDESHGEAYGRVWVRTVGASGDYVGLCRDCYDEHWQQEESGQIGMSIERVV